MSRPMMEIMFHLGQEQDKKFGLLQECKSDFKVSPLGIAVIAPIELPDDKTDPVKGVWIFRYRLERCGEAKVYNAVFSADAKGGPPASAAYYPGVSYAGANLIKDAMVSIVRGAQLPVFSKDCKKVDLFDMQVVAPPRSQVQDGRVVGSEWTEHWTFFMCGQTAEMRMTFKPGPDGKNTSYSSTLINPAPGK